MMMMRYGPSMGGWPMGGYAMALLVIGLVLFVCLLGVGAVMLRRSSDSGSHTSTPVADSPEELLAQRFARGELDEDEYVHRLQVLTRARS